ncbi:MAG TPA: gamma-glutamyl-gamma-aminobutyrate hydrolase family protein [Streptosporangiaceae bacterium]|nr:gamma-glutamyl-gamma-aminobutyrate hydrolase family protein [Streptosporangiaceae bacterium]
MRVIVVRHHSVDDAGFIADAFRARGAELTVHQFPKEGPLPSLDGVDHIVVLGAVWSVFEDRISSWIGDELDWLRAADAAGVPVLGICFGAQALTTAFGGKVEYAGRSEVGWTMVETLVPDLIDAGPWLEFHHDRCLPPAEARVLAVNELCVQAFSIGPHLAVQFHPEVDAAQVSRWLVDGGREEAEEAGQDPEKMVAQCEAEEPEAALRADRLVAAALRIARGDS